MCGVIRSLTLVALMLRVNAVRDWLQVVQRACIFIARVLQSVRGMWIKAQLRFPRNRETNIVYNAQRRPSSSKIVLCWDQAHRGVAAS